MDTDILVAKDLGEVLEKVTVGNYATWLQSCHDACEDLISYAHKKNCKMFSSNFLAGRRHSPFMKAVWEAQKAALASHCESTDPENKVCCPSDSKRCHVHWGGAGEMISHPVFDKMAVQMKSFCYAEEDGESFAPEGLGTVLFTKRRLSDALPFFQPPVGIIIAEPLDAFGD